MTLAWRALQVLGFRHIPATIYRSSLQRRAFSATSVAYRVTSPIPKFKSTSNPELDSHLTHIREEYFVPLHLPQYYYRLMYRKSNHARLADYPFIDVEGKPYELKPKENQPCLSTKKFTNTLNLMKEKSDFEVLPELIRGYNQYQHPLPQYALEKMARLANKFGAQDVLVRISGKAGDIGFKFSKTLAREIMCGLRTQQLESTKEIAFKAVKNAIQLVDTLGKRELCVDQKKRLSEDPVIVGTALSILADTYLRFNGEDHYNHTKEMALKLKACWENVEWNFELREWNAGGRIISKQEAMKSLFAARTMIRHYTPALEGILQAKSVLASSELSPWFESESERLAALIAGWDEFIKRNILILYPSGEGGGVRENSGDS